MSISNPSEVIQFCPARAEIKSRTQPICDVLEHTERHYITKVFGKDAYDALLEKVIDYSTADLWKTNENYVEGDTVLYDGVPYILVVPANTYANSPNCSNEWEVAPKFAEDCYNELWEEGGLRKIVSWVVFAEAVNFYPEVLNAAGFTTTAEASKFSTADSLDHRLNRYKSNLYKHITKMQRQFIEWNEDNGCLDIKTGCEEELNTTKNKTSRKILWR
jgi:hypothetical protein